MLALKEVQLRGKVRVGTTTVALTDVVTMRSFATGFVDCYEMYVTNALLFL